MKLQKARQAANISQEEIAHKANISLRHYQRIEKGESIPTVKIALAICKVLHVDPHDIDEWQ